MLKIRSTSLPLRCEICHQADCFDAGLNYCSRCAGNAPLEIYIKIDPAYREPVVPPTLSVQKIQQILKLMTVTGMIGFFYGSFHHRPIIAVFYLVIGMLIGLFGGILKITFEK